MIGHSPQDLASDWLLAVDGEWLVPSLVYSSVSGDQASGVSRPGGHQVTSDLSDTQWAIAIIILPTIPLIFFLICL